jgi:ATP-dependent exoDNAse (exonuclease V) alpha subunit
MLNAEQQDAVRKIRHFLSDDSLSEMLLTGPAGSGKTFTLRTALEGVNRETTGGFTVSHSAKKVLQESCGDIMEYYTVAQLRGQRPLMDEGRQVFVRSGGKSLPIHSRDLLIGDECSMIDDEMFKDINQKRPEKSKIIYSGDKYQLPPVSNSGKDSPTFQIPYKAELKNIVRYSGTIGEVASYYRTYIDYVKANRYRADMDSIFKYRPESRQRGSMVQYMTDYWGFINHTLDYFHADPYNTRILAYRNSAIDEINSYIRGLFYHPEDEYVIGEQVIMTQPFYKKEVHNGEIYIIRDIDKDISKVDLNFVENKFKPDWRKKKYPFEIYKLYLQDYTGAYKTIEVLQNKELKKYDELKANILEYDPKSNAVAKLDESFAKVSRTYATSTHKAQGQSINSVFVMANDIFDVKRTDNITKIQSLYVAISRAKHNLFVLTP